MRNAAQPGAQPAAARIFVTTPIPTTTPKMSAQGLSRRRVGAPGSSGSNRSSPTPDDDDLDRGSRGVARSQSEQLGSGTHHVNTHAGSAFAGGSKIAYDPRDLDQDAGEEARTGGKMPRLTIMEEVLLLGIKDKQVGPWLVSFISRVACGC